MWRFLLAVVLVPVFVVGASAQGLEVYLPLDGDTTDHSGNNRDGALVVGSVGTSAWTAGQVNQGLDLGLNEAFGSLEDTMVGGSYVQVNYTLPEAGTVALWYKTWEIMYNYQTLWDNSGSAGAFSGGKDNWECWMTTWGPERRLRSRLRRRGRPVERRGELARRVLVVGQLP